METTLKVTGMSCGMCVQHVTKALQDVPGVKLAAVDLISERATVKHEDGASSQAMIKAVTNAGYEVQEIGQRSMKAKASRTEKVSFEE